MALPPRNLRIDGENGNNYKSSPYFYSAIQKYGWNSFDHDILFTNLTREEACLKEQELIQECGRQLNIPATRISKICRGKGKTAKGYHFKYFNDTTNA